MLYYKKNIVDTYKYDITDIYNINTAQSTFTYPHIDLLSPVNGVNFLDGTHKPVKTFTYDSSTTSIHHARFNYVQTGEIPQQSMLIHVYGYITRDDINNTPAFYHYLDEGPKTDHISLIPANYYDTTTNIDFCYINVQTNGTTRYVWLDIFPCDTNYNVIESPSHAHITIDCYS